MIESTITALQVNATSGDGESLVLPEPRLVTFRITGNGKVTAGAVILECCPHAVPIAPGQVSGAAMVWLVTIGQRVRVSTVDVGSDLSHRQRTGGSVTAQILNIVGDEADGADSGAMAVSAFALEFGAN